MIVFYSISYGMRELRPCIFYRGFLYGCGHISGVWHAWVACAGLTVAYAPGRSEKIFLAGLENCVRGIILIIGQAMLASMLSF